jgi:hypothetical protein
MPSQETIQKVNKVVTERLGREILSISLGTTATGGVSTTQETFDMMTNALGWLLYTGKIIIKTIDND